MSGMELAVAVNEKIYQQWFAIADTGTPLKPGGPSDGTCSPALHAARRAPQRSVLAWLFA